MQSGPHGGPRDDFSWRRNPGRCEGGETDAQHEETIGNDGFWGSGAADWYQNGDYEDEVEGRTDLPESFALEDDPDSEILVGHRAAMMRGQSMGGEVAEIEPEDIRGRGVGENSAASRGSIRAASHERDSMHGWNYLLSLVKAKLLANGGKGRKLTIICGGLLSQTYEHTLRKYPGIDDLPKATAGCAGSHATFGGKNNFFAEFPLNSNKKIRYTSPQYA
jgi:hypothetical protein